jgi:hypothetical protein
MADFVAVIRRTVDGLSDNVPEMRAKVYDKARGAVRRQLESMKPQPSEDMINRQMAKLELAIAEVESDNAEALPPIDEPIAAEQPVYEAPVAEAEAQVVAHPEAVEAQEEAFDAEPAAEEQVDTVPPAEPVQEETPVEPEAAAASEPETWPSDPAAAEVISAAEPEGTEEHVSGLHSDPIWEAAEPEPAAESEPDTNAEWSAENEQPVEVASSDAVHGDSTYVQMHEPEHSEPEPAAADHHHDDAPAWGHAAVEVEPEPAPAAIASEWELPEWNDPAPVAAEAASAWSDREQTVGHAEEAVELAVERVAELARETDGDAPAAVEPTHSWSWEEGDPFAQNAVAAGELSAEPAASDWSWPVEKVSAVEAVDSPPVTDERKPGAWDEIDDLLNNDGTVSVSAATADLAPARVADPQPVDEMPAQSRPVSYRVEPKRSALNVKTIGLAAVLLLMLCGGGFAYWQNQDSVNGWVSGVIASVNAPVPAEKTVDASGSGTAETTPAADTATPAGQEVAALDAAAPTKFTQRLQADGSEVDDGPAVAAAGDSTEQEGKSVAAQTEAGKPADTAVSAETTPATTTTTEAQPAQDTTPAATDTAQPQAVPAGAQKMFLYEERLGQSAPTAIEGNVAWSVKEESPGGDAKPEPVIEAQINVPERGLTALVTIKRNADASLPASHVIEFVFSLPDTFEGGSIDSVQRVAMKRNEQDRGDALIAVPAKITEDFHMIALNDFPEAVTTNTELLRSRSWIDIPLTYRNGRRALLTLEKGPTGTEAFNKALQAWSLTATASPAAQ